MNENNEKSVAVVPRRIVVRAPVESDEPGWERAKEWMAVANQFESRKLIAHIMTGFELAELYKEHGVGPGPVPKNSNHSDSILFKQLVENKLQIPQATAYRWMRMAKKLYEEAGKGPDMKQVRQVLDRPIAEWTKENTDSVFAFVDRVTEGKTQKQLLAMETKRLKALKPRPERLGTRVEATESRRSWEELQRDLMEYGNQFTLLSEAAIQQQLDVLDVMGAARIAWLKFPTNMRTKENAATMVEGATTQIEYLKKLGTKPRNR